MHAVVAAGVAVVVAAGVAAAAAAADNTIKSDQICQSE